MPIEGTLDTARIIEFASNHPVLIAGFIGTASVLAILEWRRITNGMKQVGPTVATQLSNREDAIFLDIRDESDYRSGHIPNAIHIPLNQLASRIDELKKHRDKPVIAYCRTGNQSNGAGSILKKHGFDTVYNLDGGITAWQKSSLPITGG